MRPGGTVQKKVIVKKVLTSDTINLQTIMAPCFTEFTGC